MTRNMLQQFLRGDQSKQQDYDDFLRRFQQDPTSIPGDEAANRYRELLRNANPSLVAEAFQHVAGQLAPEQRQQLAEQFQSAHQDTRSSFNGFRFSDTSQAADPRSLGRMAAQAEQQDPDLFDRIFGQNSPLNSTLGRLVLAGVAAYLANRALGSQQKSGQSPGLPGGLSGLGGLIGALSERQQQGQNPSLPGGLGGLLDALNNQQRGQDPGLPGGLGGLLDALNNQQQERGGQNPSLPGGLGGLLDALAGGQQGGQNPSIPGGLGGLLDALNNQQGGQPQSQPAEQIPEQGVKIPGLHVKGSKTGQ